MGVPRTGHFDQHRACAAGMVAAVALATSAAAAGPSPRAAPRPAAPEGAVKAAPGVHVEYSERGGTNVLYLEEKGGMVSALAPTPPDPREAAATVRKRLPPLDPPPVMARAPDAPRP